jgi:CheY-like chemotaxis protein
MKKVIPASGKTALAPKSRPLVLYVEDNDDNWHVTELRLGRSYQLLRASTDRAACEILTQQNNFYAILMDIELGGSRLNGIELTKLIRGTLSHAALPEYARNVPRIDVPVLFVTAYGNAYDRKELLAAGADDVLLKPVEFTRLNLALANLHIQHVLVNKGK